MELKFDQDGDGMILVLANHLSSAVKYDAMMTAPDHHLVYASSCPVRAGLASSEHWPHQIKFLELSNSRIRSDEDLSGCE